MDNCSLWERDTKRKERRNMARAEPLNGEGSPPHWEAPGGGQDGQKKRVTRQWHNGGKAIFMTQQMFRPGLFCYSNVANARCSFTLVIKICLAKIIFFFWQFDKLPFTGLKRKTKFKTKHVRSNKGFVFS